MATQRQSPPAPQFVFAAIETATAAGEAEGLAMQAQFDPEHVQDLGKRAITELVQSREIGMLQADRLIWYALGQLINGRHRFSTLDM